ncbi:MAG: LytR family transcriptional regulator [Anaerolineales bacterium]|nr:MAG: LytR family transcriptional regulator [Anaerolineales bacterium]
MRSNPRRAYRSANRSQKLLTAGLVLAFAVVVIMLGVLAFDVVRDFIISSNILPDFAIDPNNGDVGYEEGLPIWRGTDRVTVLLMGIDQREDEVGPTRTDSMLLLTIDPVLKTAAVLSIPRDLWYPIPMGENTIEGRINEAHYYGDLYDWPGGGPALAADTVAYNLGIQVDYYARVNFAAFERLIDEIDGIEVCVEEEIIDPTYPDGDYGFDPLHIPAGCQHFNGEMALKYARVRHGGTDFDRAKRQQQVLQAVFDKVTRPDMLPALALRASQLWQTLQDSVRVSPDLTLTKIIALARLASEVDPANLSFHAIDGDYTIFWETPDQEQVLLPLRDRIRELRDHIFPAGPAPQGSDAQAQLEDEAAQIQVLNGTVVSGLASETRELLIQQGLDVTGVSNADRSDYTESLIIVHASKTFTAEYMRELLGLQPTAVVHAGGPAGEYDIVVILGADYAPPGG